MTPSILVLAIRLGIRPQNAPAITAENSRFGTLHSTYAVITWKLFMLPVPFPWPTAGGGCAGRLPQGGLHLRVSYPTFGRHPGAAAINSANILFAVALRGQSSLDLIPPPLFPMIGPRYLQNTSLPVGRVSDITTRRQSQLLAAIESSRYRCYAIDLQMRQDPPTPYISVAPKNFVNNVHRQD